MLNNQTQIICGKTKIVIKQDDILRQSKDPFFLYYGFRAGHNPFNSPRRFRGLGEAGEIGEAVLELDSIIGRVMDLLKDRPKYHS